MGRKFEHQMGDIGFVFVDVDDITVVIGNHEIASVTAEQLAEAGGWAREMDSNYRPWSQNDAIQAAYQFMQQNSMLGEKGLMLVEIARFNDVGTYRMVIHDPLTQITYTVTNYDSFHILLNAVPEERAKLKRQERSAAGE